MITKEKIFASDLAFNPILDNMGNLQLVTDKDAIKQSLRNILLTRQGSRVMNPIFGVGIYEFLFEPISEQTAREIMRRFLQQVSWFEPRITMEGSPSVIISENPPGYTIEIKYQIIKYSIYDQFGLEVLKN